MDDRESENFKAPIDYASPRTNQSSRLDGFDRSIPIAIGWGLAIFIVNVLLFTVRASRDWDGLLMAVYGIPFVNGIFLFGGVAVSPLISRFFKSASLYPYILTTTLLPLIAVALDFFGPH